jgi:hypothetical protein
MKFLTHTLLIFLIVSGALAQAPSDPKPAPGVAILQNSWRKVIRNPALDDDPLRASRETIELENAKRETARINQVLRDLGREQIPPPTQGSSGIRMGKTTVTYVYEARIRNDGDKTLKAVVWHYSFFDAEKKEEVGRTAMTSKVNLRPGKITDLSGVSRTSPVRVVDAQKSGQELKGLYTEKVVITRLEYSDGTFWQQPTE